MNAFTWALVFAAAWALTATPFIWLAARLFRSGRGPSRRAVNRALADPRFWERAEADLRRQP